jgi:hypothetical protein
MNFLTQAATVQSSNHLGRGHKKLSFLTLSYPTLLGNKTSRPNSFHVLDLQLPT